MTDAHDLSCTAKLVQVVLDNCGPLAPSEVATEARIAEGDATEALAELQRRGRVTSVCGVCSTREEVYELSESPGRERSA